MKITAIIVTCNRLELLPRALQSVSGQTRKSDYVYVVSNSTKDNYFKEQEICEEFGFELFKNYRSENYAGALNTGVEEIVKQQGIADNIYFASLDDDDVWLPDYLKEIETNNNDDFDLIAANYLRKSDDENLLMVLPGELSTNDFLKGNPGIGGSNTFIRLKILLKAGCFDEAMHSSVDRDFFVRVFQQKPKYKIIQKHLVTAYTDKNRERLTTNQEKKINSLQIFYYKFHNLMSDEDKNLFFKRARNYFSIERSKIEIKIPNAAPLRKSELEFNKKGKYQFIIGLIGGNEIIVERIANEILDKKILVDFILIIDDTPKGKNLDKVKELLSKISKVRIVEFDEWFSNLKKGKYGTYFQRFDEINSIPMGRTILHHHLYSETIEFTDPIFWVIDDDVSFSNTTFDNDTVDLFNVINDNLGVTDAVIGSISNDPPIPTLSCIRTQLVDFYYSKFHPSSGDLLKIQMLQDYYYDLSDLHSNHLEIPIYHKNISERHLREIFSGKSVSRPALQQTKKSEYKTVTNRGANTLVLNRKLLQHYPVINLEVNNKFARRGDLLWALFNQLISGRKIKEHSFAINHNRPITEFKLSRELDKSAYDIIGYAFNKGFLTAIQEITIEHNNPKKILSSLSQDSYFKIFRQNYFKFLNKRKSRFLMNYYRIIGLTKLLSEDFEFAHNKYIDLNNEVQLEPFYQTIKEAENEDNLRFFIKEIQNIINNYTHSV